MSEIFKNADPVLKSNFKILLLGGTGQGKTSFMNFIANA
jgi:polynucleotide 5'-kinase involved in rRNA processing